MDQQTTNSEPQTIRVSWNDDIFSSRTIKECEEIFQDHCEVKVDQFLESKEKLSILRSCLDLLNRLEGTTHKRFAGRVLVFLARVIPLYDQSGVNLRSDFCPYELPPSVKKYLDQKDAQENQARSNDVEIEEGETLSDDDDEENDNNPSEKPKEDLMKLFYRFWKVQEYLHHPNQLYDKNTWLIFKMLVDTMMIHFEHTPTTRKMWNLANSFMTEPKAFSLQLDDINLRRCFLVQILIALQYLEFPVETRPDSLILSKHQTSWIETTNSRIYSLLATTPSTEEGRDFCSLVRQVLKCEELWNQWKNEKCKEPKLGADNQEDDLINMGVTYYRRRKMSDELKCAKPYSLHVIGSQEMSKLWNKCPNEPELPVLAKYFTAPQESFKNPNVSFKTLRLSRKSPYFFKPTKDSIKSIDEYLKNLSEKYSQSIQ